MIAPAKNKTLRHGAKADNILLRLGPGCYIQVLEIVALVNIGESNVKTFLWKNIITRFGIPKAFISNNKTQLKNQKNQEFCREYKTFFDFVRDLNFAYLRPFLKRAKIQYGLISRL